MKELEVMDAQTLLYHPLEKPKFILDGLIPSGLSLFCGSQKNREKLADCSGSAYKYQEAFHVGLPQWKVKSCTYVWRIPFYRIQDSFSS
jgi:hypothetical protein